MVLDCIIIHVPVKVSGHEIAVKHSYLWRVWAIDTKGGVEHHTHHLGYYKTTTPVLKPQCGSEGTSEGPTNGPWHVSRSGLKSVHPG